MDKTRCSNDYYNCKLKILYIIISCFIILVLGIGISYVYYKYFLDPTIKEVIANEIAQQVQLPPLSMNNLVLNADRFYDKRFKDLLLVLSSVIVIFVILVPILFSIMQNLKFKASISEMTAHLNDLKAQKEKVTSSYNSFQELVDTHEEAIIELLAMIAKNAEENNNITLISYILALRLEINSNSNKDDDIGDSIEGVLNRIKNVNKCKKPVVLKALEIMRKLEKDYTPRQKDWSEQINQIITELENYSFNRPF